MPTVYSGSQIAIDRLSMESLRDIAMHSSWTLLDSKVNDAEDLKVDSSGLLLQDSTEEKVVGYGDGPSTLEPKQPKHGFGALVDEFKMIKLLLFSGKGNSKLGVGSNRQDSTINSKHRRIEARPEPGAEIPVPIRQRKQRTHLRGNEIGGGAKTVRDVSPLDFLLRPGVFNRAITLFPMEKMSIMIVFIVDLAVHIGVAVLLFFHAYLVATAQTTLEFNINMSRRNSSENNGRVGSLYDRGSMKENFEDVFGPYPILLSLLPSSRGVHNPDDYYKATGHFSRNRARVDTGYGNLLDV